MKWLVYILIIIKQNLKYKYTKKVLLYQVLSKHSLKKCYEVKLRVEYTVRFTGDVNVAKPCTIMYESAV